ncbi:DUF1059 domain-containing protein [Spirosoma sp. KCTC 42546]|uniref:DUF1059 domain-containing protein n=1 Tax=Spirosoma sp. KCTC 42546 TaxID=2520506 RepID=UPI001159C706|nr:DUF1059 domain-containing protein [Spirosoma sp. KCTC 42546]QDK81577.1 DUF1059 domain-containing protein [Spirosoma sp. KCTC 42546]
MKVLHCHDAGFNCAGIIRASTESEVLELATQHAELVHQVTLTPVLVDQMKGLIRDEAD